MLQVLSVASGCIGWGSSRAMAGKAFCLKSLIRNTCDGTAHAHKPETEVSGNSVYLYDMQNTRLCPTIFYRALKT